MKRYSVKISIFVIFFVFGALLNSVGILVERSQTLYGATKSEAAILEPFKDLSIALVAFFAGSFLPKLGYKKALLSSLIIVFFACLGIFFLNSFWGVKMLFLAVGVSFAVVKVSVLALIGEVTKNEKEHSSVMNLTESIFMLGIITMYLIFPFFYSDINPDNWLYGFLFLAAMVLIAFIFIAYSKIDVQYHHHNSLQQSVLEMRNLLRSKLVLIFTCFAFFYVMTEQGIMSWLPTFNNNVLHLSPKLSAQMSVILMVSIAFGRFVSSIISKKIGWFYIAMVCVIGAGIFLILVLPLAENIHPQKINSLQNIPVVSFIFPLIGIFLAPMYPLVNSALLSHTPKNQQSSLAGILTFFSAIGGTVGSMVIGNLFEKLGGERVFYLSLIPLLIILITFIFINKWTKRG